jgi:hypothetical protein
MKIDKKTYKDKKEKQIGMTADHTSRPDKVLFFTDSHFSFYKSLSTLSTLACYTSHRSDQNLPKSVILLNYNMNNIFYKLKYRV